MVFSVNRIELRLDCRVSCPYGRWDDWSETVLECVCHDFPLRDLPHLRMLYLDWECFSTFGEYFEGDIEDYADEIVHFLSAIAYQYQPGRTLLETIRTAPLSGEESKALKKYLGMKGSRSNRVKLPLDFEFRSLKTK